MHALVSLPHHVTHYYILATAPCHTLLYTLPLHPLLVPKCVPTLVASLSRATLPRRTGEPQADRSIAQWRQCCRRVPRERVGKRHGLKVEPLRRASSAQRRVGKLGGGRLPERGAARRCEAPRTAARRPPSRGPPGAPHSASLAGSGVRPARASRRGPATGWLDSPFAPTRSFDERFCASVSLPMSPESSGELRRAPERPSTSLAARRARGPKSAPGLADACGPTFDATGPARRSPAHLGAHLLHC